jgi:hypothetical protein
MARDGLKETGISRVGHLSRLFRMSDGMHNNKDRSRRSWKKPLLLLAIVAAIGAFSILAKGTGPGPSGATAIAVVVLVIAITRRRR